MTRPLPARWFEIVVARDDAFLALEALAEAGCVEIEWHARAAAADAPAIAAALREHARLARRHAPYWPPPAHALPPEHRAPADALVASVDALRAWERDADPVIAGLQAAEAELATLALAERGLLALAGSGISARQLAQARHGVAAALFALPPDARPDLPADLIVRRADAPAPTASPAPAATHGTADVLLLAVGAPASLAALQAEVEAERGRRAAFPDWFGDDPQANLAQRRAACETVAAAARTELAALARRHAVARHRATVARAQWCVEHGGAIDASDARLTFARITGWTVDRARIVAAIEAGGARALVAFPPPPRDARPPLVLRNPWWARPFELFPRLVGLPGAQSTDPSMLLALAVPLMFGTMFGDVGQGLVLVAAGLALRRRWPVLQLLIPCGLAATGFGFVFGSLFCDEHLLAPLWLRPLEAPLTVLAAPLAAGAALLAAGLLIGGLDARWQGRGTHWLHEDAPVLLAYGAAACALIEPAAAWGVALALAWAMLAAARAEAPDGRAAARGPAARALAAAGEFGERFVQLLINTLSFARVGAFALAHAGLASAVIGLAAAADAPLAQALVLVLGNALILAVEGLVVSIQTTRLVLFEFFTRFYRPEGREFRPLAPPPVHLLETP